MRPRFADVLALVALVLLALACFGRLAARPDHLIVDGARPSVDYNLRGDARDVGNDLTGLFLPHHLHAAELVRRLGRIPGWDASGFAGRPMIGNPQGGLFYPPVWLAWAARSPSALGWLTVGHLVWGGLGAYLLARRIKLGRFPATVAAGCFEASPYLLGHVFEGHYPHVWAACWYPWACLAFLRFRDGETRGALALPVILALMFLTGHPQEWYYLVFALGVWTLHDAIRSKTWKTGAARLLAFAGLVGLGLGLVALELVPDLFAQAWTLRGPKLGSGGSDRYHLHVMNLWQLLDPAALGGPADYFGHDNAWEAMLSIGLAPLSLVLIALAGHRDRDRVRGWLVLVAAALAFAAGRKLGLFPILTALVPGMARFRVPARALFLADLGAAMLAGLGVQAMGRLASDELGWRRLDRSARRATMAVLAGLAVVLALGWIQPPHAPTFAGRPGPAVFGRSVAPRNNLGAAASAKLAAVRVAGNGTFWLALLGTAFALAYGSRTHDNGRRACAFGLGLLALVELGMHGRSLIAVAPAGQFLGPDPIGAAIARAGSPWPGSGPFRIRARDVLYSDLHAQSNGFEKVNINDSFQLAHAAMLHETLYPLLYVEPAPDPDECMAGPVASFRRAVRQGVLDRMGVAFLVSDHVEPNPAWPLVASGTWGGRSFAVHRNPSAMPRAYVVPRALVQDRDGARGALALFRSVDPRAAVVMPSLPADIGDGPGQPFTPASYDAADPDRVVIRVATGAPGLLVVADTWMPGWSARVDGRPSLILRGNVAQRVIPLPRPGRHEVILRYEPPGLAAGLALTSLSAIAWVVAWSVAGRGPTRRSAVRAGQGRRSAPAEAIPAMADAAP